MAQADGTQNSQDREREGLDDFTDRFGKLADRMEQAAHPDLERQELPSAEHPDSVKAREAQQAAQSEQHEHDIWPGKTSQPDFERAVPNDNSQTAREGVNSLQVSQDAPEHNLPPPQDSEEQNRATHATRMSQDDTRAKRPMTDQYYNRLAKRMREAELDRAASGQNQSRDCDQGAGLFAIGSFLCGGNGEVVQCCDDERGDDYRNGLAEIVSSPFLGAFKTLVEIISLGLSEVVCAVARVLRLLDISSMMESVRSSVYE